MTTDPDEPVSSCAAPAGCATYATVGFIAWLLDPDLLWLWVIFGALLLIGLVGELTQMVQAEREMRRYHRRQARRRRVLWR